MPFPWAAVIGGGIQTGFGILNYQNAERDRNQRRQIYQAEVRRREREMDMARSRMALEKQNRDSERNRSSMYQDQLSYTPWRTGK